MRFETLGKKENPAVKGFFHFLAKVGDGMMKMKIVRIDFRPEKA